MRRIRAIFIKEVFHILRDPFTLMIALGLPIILLIIFGLAIDLDVKNIYLSVYDKDKSYTTRTIVDTFSNSNLFSPQSTAENTDPEALLRNEKSKVVFVFEEGFEKKRIQNQTPSLQILVDGSDNSIIGSIMTYTQGSYLASLDKFETQPKVIQTHTRFLYNPELRSPDFIVPGLFVIIVSIVSILLTALTIAREWETGSMELLLSTPVRPLEILLGKIGPYTILGLIAGTFIFLAATLGFNVPFRGNILIFIFACTLFISAYLAQGLLISTVLRKQQAAMQGALLSGFLPSMLLSGFMFPIENMPTFFQYFTMIFPARWFMEISRDQFLKGSPLSALTKPLLFLFIINVFFILVASKKTKKDLET